MAKPRNNQAILENQAAQALRRPVRSDVLQPMEQPVFQTDEPTDQNALQQAIIDLAEYLPKNVQRAARAPNPLSMIAQNLLIGSPAQAATVREKIPAYDRGIQRSRSCSSIFAEILHQRRTGADGP